jgi:hypothetical protein
MNVFCARGGPDFPKYRRKSGSRWLLLAAPGPKVPQDFINFRNVALAMTLALALASPGFSWPLLLLLTSLGALGLLLMGDPICTSSL